MLTEKTCREFTAELASNKPVPGGGGGAALAGSLAVSLCAMAGNFTVGKKKYADVEEEAKELLTECEELRIRLLNLVEADAEAFEPLSKAYSIPKDDPARADKLEEATMNAIMAPLDIMDACADVIELLDRMLGICNRMMISDVACGAILAGAAMKAASINVFVNTATLRDRVKASEYEMTADRLLEDYLPMAEVIAEEVTADLRDKGDEY